MYDYDFALSFAGEDRKRAESLATLLKNGNARVFYDVDYQAELWGKDLYQTFQKIYGEKSKFFIPFVSSNYLEKNWPKHELKQAQARDFKSEEEYILPLRLDDSSLPGLNETIGYLDLRIVDIETVSQLCLKKLNENLVGPLNPNISDEMRLYLWLKEHNPSCLDVLKLRKNHIVVRVSLVKSVELQNLMNQINPNSCIGKDMHNFLMTGGSGPGSCFPSIDPEPHTTFSITFSDEFFNLIPI